MKIRTDLALEAREMIDEKKSAKMEISGDLPKGMTVDTRENEYIITTDIVISSEEAQKIIGKRIGRYITLEIKNSILDSNDNQDNIASNLSKEVLNIVGDFNGKTIMIAGLGNRNITADSLGPKVADKIVVTRHVINLQKEIEIDERLGNVCAVSPGVMGLTGIETGDIIKGMISTVKPDCLIVIDALASRKTSRVNSTIQISDTGIVPGSGVGNHRMELSKETLGIPVISIGVPTVVDALTLAKDLVKIENEINCDIKFDENLGDMIVTPKNIDISIERMSDVVAAGINMAVHKGFSVSEIKEYLI